MALHCDGAGDENMPSSSPKELQHKIPAAPFRKRRECISPRLVLNDFLSPRLSTTQPAHSGRIATSLDRDKRPLKLTKSLLARRKDRGCEATVLQDSLRSRFITNLEKNLDNESADDIWTYHRCREYQAKDPLERRLLEQGITPVYDPEYKEILCRQLVPDLLDLRIFLVTPAPKLGEHFQCNIYRKHEPNKLYSRYKLCLNNGNRFLLSARKRKKSKSSNYVVSIDEKDISNKTGNYFGKVRSNFLGTEFMFYDKGERPRYDLGYCFSPMNIRMELGGVIYQRSMFGPRRMTAVIPGFSEDAKPHVFRPLLKGSSTILQKFKSGLDLDKMAVLRSKLPKWNPQIQTHCLNFAGRQGSKSDFQLVHHDSLVLQFRKVETNVYSMAYKFPVSPFQAFAICLSSLDSK